MNQGRYLALETVEDSRPSGIALDFGFRGPGWLAGPHLCLTPQSRAPCPVSARTEQGGSRGDRGNLRVRINDRPSSEFESTPEASPSLVLEARDLRPAYWRPIRQLPNWQQFRQLRDRFQMTLCHCAFVRSTPSSPKYKVPGDLR